MLTSWFKNPENIVSADAEVFARCFGKALGVEDLDKRIQEFKMNPVKGGLDIYGKNELSILIFVPNLMFNEKIQMGNCLWAYLNPTEECYCLR